MILITLANTPYFNEIEKNNLLDLLKNVIRSCNALNLKVLYRLDRKFIDALDLKNIDNNIADTIEVVLGSVKTVIVSPSTVALQAMNNGLPTALLIYRDTPIYYSAGWLLHRSTDLDLAIKSMLNPDPERMLFQLNEIRSNCSTIDLGDAIASIDFMKLRNDSYSDYYSFTVNRILESKFNFNLFAFIFKLKSLAKIIIRKCSVTHKIYEYFKG